ncbi:MAG: carbohydrate-binding domain-containing protein [Spirochaetaceae bacterium]|jgi:hypothetical protein|nr:carbohydrate-binding domain-containing protein [Spirochaetaceae bacterium]
MKRNKGRFWAGAFFMAAALLWTGCSNSVIDATARQDDDQTGAPPPPVVAADPGDAADGVLVPASKDAAALGLASPVVIVFNEGAAPTITEGALATVSAVASRVAVTLTGGGANIVAQGVSADGSLTVSGNHAFNLHLNGVGLANAGGAAINNDGSGAMTVTLVEGTTSRLIDGAASGDKAALYSKGDLRIVGSGSLEVRGKAAHALASKGAFSQTGGAIWVKEALKDGVNAATVTVTGGSFASRTVGDGIQGDDGVTITGGTFAIITAATTADNLTNVKAHGVKSDGDIVIGAGGAGGTGPDMTITVYGSGSKGMSADGDLAIHGGTLTLNTAGNGYWDASSDDADKTSGCAGLKCDGDLLIDGGVLTILSVGAGGKGISVDGDILITGGAIDVTTAGKAYVYGAYDAKSKAIKSDNNVTINGGAIAIKTYEDGAEGLECEYALTINGGTIEIDSYDDAINASGGTDGKSGNITITGGNVFCNASGNDGIDSNGAITISGGTIISLGASGPEEGFDCDDNTFTVTGGALIGLGGSTSKPTTSVTTASTVECNVAAATLYRIESSAGVEIMTFAPPRSYSGTVCLLFGGGMERGVSYTLYSGGSVSGGTDFHGLYSGATYAKGTLEGTFTASAYATIGTPSGFPGPGGPPGGPPGRSFSGAASPSPTAGPCRNSASWLRTFHRIFQAKL